MALFLAPLSCDVGGPRPLAGAGPALHIISITPEPEQGFECEPGERDSCGVPINATLRVRFDRYLDPSTANRQGIRVYTGDPEVSPVIPFLVRYDPLERVVTYAMPEGFSFAESTLYRVEFPVPEEPDDFGFRAYDGAALEEGSVPLEFGFFTGNFRVSEPPLRAPSCEQIVREVFARPLGNCQSAQCHASEENEFGAAPHGLWLDRRVHVRATAIGRVARQTEIAPQSGVPLEDSPRFGAAMPIIDAGNPGNSYVVYKLLLGQQNFLPCSTSGAPLTCSEADDPCRSIYPALALPEDDCLAPSPQERARLREWFVRGEPMPIQRNDSGDPVPRSVGLQGLRAVVDFIAAGADCTE